MSGTAPLLALLPPAPPPGGSLPAGDGAVSGGTDVPTGLFANLLVSQFGAALSAQLQATGSLAPVKDGDASKTTGASDDAGMPQDPAAACAALLPALFAQIALQSAPSQATRAAGAETSVAPQLATAGTPLPLGGLRKDVPDSPAEKPGGAANGPGEAARISSIAANVASAPAQTVRDEAAHEAARPVEPGTDGATFQSLLASAQESARAAAGHGQAHAADTIRPQLAMEAAVGTPAWGRELGDKVSWMVNREQSQAALVLTPPQLGRIEVSLNINGDQANATFVSANPAVRDALEQALPRLREMLADAGIRLDQAQVGADSGSPQGGERRDNRAASAALREADLPTQATAVQWLQRGKGMVDTFA